MFLFSFMAGDSRSYSPSCRDLPFAFTLVMQLMGTESWRHGVYCYGDAGERDVDANPLLRMIIYRCDVTQRDAFDSIKEEEENIVSVVFVGEKMEMEWYLRG